MSDFTASHSATIDAPIEEVWRALTTPDLIKQWFFGVDTETDWKVGSPLVHRGQYRGEPHEDKGEIVRFDPPKRLVHTHWSDLSGKPDSRTAQSIIRRSRGPSPATTERPSSRSRSAISHPKRRRRSPTRAGGWCSRT